MGKALRRDNGGDGTETVDPLPFPTPVTGDGRDAFSAAEIGAIAHLYRGEVYRSTLWRTRLDNTTNWAIVTTGLAFSISFASPQASALPLLLVGILVAVFVLFEARRYRYFNVWRARARHMETQFYAPLLRGECPDRDGDWNEILAHDYCEPRHHISMLRAFGRRLRRNYAWILVVQAMAYYGKLMIHPAEPQSLAEFFDRATLGPLPGEFVIGLGLLFHGGWIFIAGLTHWQDTQVHRNRKSRVAMG
ncbi:MAG: DUF2270 domain-containing protein [Magnetovibrionaceae bacterium]